jgi:hypothetical protein
VKWFTAEKEGETMTTKNKISPDRSLLVDLSDTDLTKCDFGLCCRASVGVTFMLFNESAEIRSFCESHLGLMKSGLTDDHPTVAVRFKKEGK